MRCLSKVESEIGTDSRLSRAPVSRIKEAARTIMIA